MPTQFPDEPTERHLAPDQALMEAARARGAARWAAAGDLPEQQEKPPAGPFKPRTAAIVAIVALLVLGGIAIATFDGGSGSGGTDVANPSHSYIPGLITPPEELPAESTSANSLDPSLASSALGLMPTPTQNAVPPPARDTAKPPAGAKSFTTGPGCGGYTSVGSYRDGRRGWVDHGDGKCGSTFVSIPMSGDARRDDTSAYALWTFAATGTCDVSVHIPNGGLQEVGGNPTVYYVFDRNGVGGTPMASFAIKQVDKRGQWVAAGRFKASGNLTVQLVTRGQDWNNSGPTYAHHAASALKADCTA
ncbi:hypothetical protein SAMN04488074_13067 [Lentzea albidocapillata subsp. violacea]|uniref:Uncharacterized protein n=1 Tax=Lentzea albidocapillata subsp. violacea TaxID=128104 RepID=A0A1G9XKY5_9PSEU|nr:hypothetical protein [Lentzea albidocapillata]SDM97076.1 hypothetical protein SAMN04488074_13067 [Lentzea albidocapillata subsp. violacea]